MTILYIYIATVVIWFTLCFNLTVGYTKKIGGEMRNIPVAILVTLAYCCLPILRFIVFFGICMKNYEYDKKNGII